MPHAVPFDNHATGPISRILRPAMMTFFSPESCLRLFVIENQCIDTSQQRFQIRAGDVDPEVHRVDHCEGGR